VAENLVMAPVPTRATQAPASTLAAAHPGIEPVQITCDPPASSLRARIEQTIGKLKRFKRVAMRCEKTDISYSAIISFACGLILVKSVHTA
jgi:hypothetical protein